MGLRDLVIPSAEIAVPGNESPLVVRGLGLDAIVFLARCHGEALGDLYRRAEADDLQAEDAAALALDVVDDLPFLAAQAIALGAGEADAWEAAMRLPAPVQVEALEAVIRLTVAGDGLGKTVEIVGRALREVSSRMPKRPAT